MYLPPDLLSTFSVVLPFRLVSCLIHAGLGLPSLPPLWGPSLGIQISCLYPSSVQNLTITENPPPPSPSLSSLPTRCPSATLRPPGPLHVLPEAAAPFSFLLTQLRVVGVSLSACFPVPGAPSPLQGKAPLLSEPGLRSAFSLLLLNSQALLKEAQVGQVNSQSLTLGGAPCQASEDNCAGHTG